VLEAEPGRRAAGRGSGPDQVLDGELGAYVYLVAGPPGMVEAMETVLREAGVPEEQVRPSRFSGY